MKLTKKILSLVLAAALVLGSIAVAANAADYDGLAYEGSKLTYKIEADKTEVKPGETVTFSVYMTSNYYTGSAGGEFFLWNAGVFDALGSNYTVKNYRTKFTSTYRNPANVNSYPTNYGKTDYVGFQAVHAYNADNTQALMLDNELVYTFTFTVLETATPGTTAKFFIPAEALKSDALTGMKGMTYQGIATSAVDATNTKAYAQTVDLSQASVTITVASAAVLGEITDVVGSSTNIGDTAVVTVNVTGAPEKLTVTTPDGTYDYTRDNANISTTETGEEWLIEVPVNVEGENACTVTADYGEAGVTPATAFTVTGIGYCDYGALEAAVAKTPEKSEEYYDAEAYKAWADAKAAGQALLDAEKLYDKDDNQDTIDAAAQLIETTFAALEANEVDLTKLNNAVNSYSEIDPADADYYNADDYAAWQQALAAAKDAQTSYAGQPATKQGEVDDIADALEAAYTKLVPAYVDITPVQEAIADCETLDYSEEYYDAAAYAAWEQALADAQAGVTTYTGAADTAANREAVAALAQALRDAYAEFDPRFVDASAIANAITAYGTTEYSAEYYDVDEYAAYTAALAAANDADFTGKPDTQANRDAVAKIADDLKVAFEALDARFLDTTPITDAIAACVPDYTEEYYDASVWANFQEVVSSGATIAEDYKDAADTAENRELVQYYVDEINAWYAKLVPQFVSYEKLEKAVADYAQPEHPEFYYTPDSWAAYQDALAAAKDANENRPEPLPAANDNNQAAIDALADALENAYNELEAAVCHVISVTPLQENYVVNNWINFAVLVEGTPAKIQLVKESGVTSTYSPDTPQVVSITDNGDGTQTWVINRRVFEEEYTEYAKAKMGRNWDTGVVPYDVKCTVEDAEVKSVEVTLDGEVVDTALRTDFPTVTIVTGPATKKVRLLDPVTGGSLTYAEPTSVNEDGTKVWVIVKQYYQVKQYDLDILFLGSTGTYVDSGLDLEINIVEERESQLPSTDKAEDAIYSAEVAKTRILKGSTQTFTYTTDKDCKAVRILNADGSVFRTIKTSTSVEDGVATWVYECAYNSLGERSYTAEALYGETWIADVDSAVSFNIAY